MPDICANRTILVTGASGFLGSAVASQLGAKGFKLRTTGRQAFPSNPLPNYRPLDLCDERAVSQLVAGTEIVIHAAGLAHQHRATSSSESDFFRVNARGAEVVARAAGAAGCRRFVLVSSVAVYGNGSPPKTEADPCWPSSPYARSKLEAERLATEAAAAANMELIILRMATVYGENDPGNVGRLLRAIDRCRFVWVGTGQNYKSLVHVEDAAAACVTAATHKQALHPKTFNVASDPCTVRSIVATIADALERRIPSVRLPARLPLMAAAFASRVPGLARRARRIGATLEKWISDDVFDAALFRETFAWRPQVTLEDGILGQVARHRTDTRHAYN
jgi:nucleoside-diphosphate-sugar epimerase